MGAMNIGLTIRHEREGQGLTRKQLGARAGTTKKVIEGIERAAYSPTLEQLEGIANALELDVVDLIERAGKREPAFTSAPPAPYTMTVNEVAETLGRPRTTVTSLVRAGKLPAIKHGWRTFIDAGAVERLRQTPTN
jgi:excisionase family DNA binding protein